MEFANFKDLQKRLQVLYQNKEFVVALDLATRQFDRFPENRILLYYWRITMAVRTGDIPMSLRLLQEALTSGIWYGETLLRKSPALKALQGLPEFEKLVDLNQELEKEDQQQLFPLITLRPEGRCQQGSDACPLLLALHANSSNAQGSMDFWKPAATAGWLVAAPQSTQAIWKGSYIWDDREITESEIRKYYSLLRGGYSINPRCTVLAGHSMGGETAIWLALKNVIETIGFIAIGPGGPLVDELDSWEPIVRENLAGNLRGYIITGEADTEISHQNIRNLVERLDQAGISCKLEIIPGAGHDYVPEYDACFLRALEFLTD
jgi:dienelactone hydrolase